MYEYIWDDQTGGILLTTNQSKFSKEPRPVYYPEMDLMGFNKYYQFQKATEALLAEKKAERLENDKIREEYNQLNAKKRQCEEELQKREKQYTAAIN